MRSTFNQQLEHLLLQQLLLLPLSLSKQHNIISDLTTQIFTTNLLIVPNFEDHYLNTLIGTREGVTQIHKIKIVHLLYVV